MRKLACPAVARSVRSVRQEPIMQCTVLIDVHKFSDLEYFGIASEG